MKKIYLLFSLIVLANSIFAQQKNQQQEELVNLLIEKKLLSQEEADSFRSEQAIKDQQNIKDKKFTIDLELRNRSEYRNGYQNPLIPSNATIKNSGNAAFFVNQRSRIGFNYLHKNKLGAQLSFQDLRVWGSQDPRSNAGTVQLFEAYVEPYLNAEWSVRVGRQKLVFDNQRLFAENDWRLNANAHDAVNLRYQGNNLSSELAFAYNQNAENASGTTYNTSSFAKPTYKDLVVSYLKYKPSNELTLSAINATDGYQATTTLSSKPEKVYQRFTSGGRIEYEVGDFYATLSAYYQYGVSGNSGTAGLNGKRIDAYYFQPEIKYNLKSYGLITRLGAEIFSGDKDPANAGKSSRDYSFDPLYGVAHRFNGNIDFFTTFPKDIKSAGLVNPYLFLLKSFGEKFSVKSDFHWFYTLYRYDAGKTNESYSKKLGFEQDIAVVYKPNSYINLEVGYSYLLGTSALGTFKGTDARWDDWAYVQLSVKPQIFKALF